MLVSIVDHLACPACGGAFAATSFDAAATGGEACDRIATGVLDCGRCGGAVPVCAGFPLFPERREAGSFERDELASLEHACFADRDRMLAFVRAKFERPTVDRYAAFLPFNEAARAFLPLVPLLREQLRPGDLILDLFNRTGWTGEFLAGLFPEQQVVSLWEGNRDVLGYRGFAFWLGERQRQPNHAVCFASTDRRLPFREGAVAAVHGFDVLHRHDPEALIAEVLRVCNGPIAFPHVHLSNAEPEPYFDRGEIHRHGRHYRDHLAAVLDGSERGACVLSERKLFDAPDELTLVDDADTQHYNALVAIVPTTVVGRRLRPEPSAKPQPADRPLVHPLLTLDLDAARVALEPDGADSQIREMLRRHPIQEALLRAAAAAPLAQIEVEILHGARQAWSLGEVARRTERGFDEVAAAARDLVERGILAIQPISVAMARLQRFFVDQVFIPPEAEQTLDRLFRTACRRHAERPLILSEEDDSVFRYADAAHVVEMLAARFRSAGVRKGSRVCIHAALSPEALFAFWACATLGAVCVPIDPDRPGAALAATLGDPAPRLVLLDGARAVADVWPSASEIVVFDDEANLPCHGWPRLSDWLRDDSGPLASAPETIAPDDPIAILHTSGTTAAPKAVVISHGALYRSGEVLARHAAWSDDDVLLSPGELHAISGLRNPAVAVLHAGAAVVTAAQASRTQTLALADLIHSHRVSVLTTVPAAIRSLLLHRSRLRSGALGCLRQVLSTASRLPPELADEFEAQFGLRVIDYYGATETTGISLGTFGGDEARAGRGIGRPLDCVAQIVSDSGRVVADGETGELRIFSDRLMQAGPSGDRRSDGRLRGGWYQTGDLAFRDESGCVHLLGRASDFLKTATGDRVAIAEISAVLCALPGVETIELEIETAPGADDVARVRVFPSAPVDDLPGFFAQLQQSAASRLGLRRSPLEFELGTRPGGASPTAAAVAEDLHDV